MEILKEDIEVGPEWKMRRLLALARGFRDLAVLAAVIGFIVLPFLQLYPTYPGLLSALLLGALLALAAGTVMRRRVPYRYFPRPKKGRYEMLPAIDVVKYQLRQLGVKEISQEPVLRGTLRSHHPDLIFKANGETYMAEVKVRSIVPSDIDNAVRILEDCRSERPDIRGVLLFSRTTPAPSVMRMARAKGVDIRVISKLEQI
jgi:hypothetical protein